MNSIATPDPQPSSAPVPPVASRPMGGRLATGALLIPCVCWGFGLMLSKEGAESINRAGGRPSDFPFGPIWLLAVRFIIGGVLWLAIFPRARRGWSPRTLKYGASLGLMLGFSMSMQHLGLVRTSEAVAAFLAALSVLFVPLISMLLFGKKPRWYLWIGIMIALAGIYLMTRPRNTGFGLGEGFGIFCALCFSFYYLAVNAMVPRDDPFRLTGIMFIFSGLICLLFSGGIGFLIMHQTLGQMSALLLAPHVARDTILLIFFPTVIAFGSVLLFQPHVDASRAVIIYLTEPVFAAVVAYIFKHHTLAPSAIVGGALILIANALTELLELRRERGRRLPRPTKPQPELA